MSSPTSNYHIHILYMKLHIIAEYSQIDSERCNIFSKYETNKFIRLSVNQLHVQIEK